MDRSMADNFFRPAFTQGVWATGELPKGLNYLAFVGNGLNTLNISATKIDTSLLVAGSVWWEPLGNYGAPGKAVNMYDDYFAQKKVRIRIGTSFTRSPEDRFSDLDQSNPDNTSQYNSDGVLTFSTGAFAPGVTVQRDLYKMSAIDGGIKYNGLAINGQYYMRWLSNFEADGPMPVTSTFDHGFELSASYFVIPKDLLVYGRSSQVFGAVWQLVRVRWRRQMVFPSDRAFMAQRRADAGPQITLWRGVYSVYRRYERLGADGAVGHRFLTIRTSERLVYRSGLRATNLIALSGPA